ncbi:MAG: dimethyl sulfoxide reductase anchor subunit [Coriobacteriia bacterium]|nr:dimethyl sulfoxide reductase anchor subunit [Coriobacteriia bacterium]
MISEFPLMLFTVLTGIACGAYVGAALFPKKGADEKAWLFPVVVLVLAACGGLAATGHLGRPENIFNVLNNPGASITMEGICTGVLAVVAIIDLVLSKQKGEANRAVRIVGAIVGIVFLCIVTSVYTKSYGNPLWTATPTYGIFVLGGLAAGFGCWKLFADEDAKALDLAACAVSVLFALVLVWQASVFGDAEGMVLIAVGAVLALAAAVVAYLSSAGKMNAKTAGLVLAVLTIAALAVSRYGFYAASII